MIPFPPFIPVHLFFKAWLFVLTSTSHRSVSCDAAVLHAWSQLYASFKKSVQTSPCLLSHLLTPGVPQSSGELKKNNNFVSNFHGFSGKCVWYSPSFPESQVCTMFPLLFRGQCSLLLWTKSLSHRGWQCALFHIFEPLQVSS